MFYSPGSLHHYYLIDNSAIRYFLGLHRFAPLAGLADDMGWIGVRERMIMKMCGFYNKIQKTTNKISIDKRQQMIDY